MSISRLLSVASSEIDFPAATSRLLFIPITDSLASHEANGHAHLSNALSADVPPSWPPQPVAPPVHANEHGWKNSYLTHAGPNGNRSVVVGVAGHKKWSPEDKTLQIGAVLVPEYHGQHLGEEVVAALANWGLTQPEIDRVICDVPDNHKASAKSLERAGFTASTEKPAHGFTRFEIKKT
jgi:RimJ/RimL family protein N-acetyltransferase